MERFFNRSSMNSPSYGHVQALRIGPRPRERRGAAQLRAHYAIERELAARLRGATKEQRRRLYTEVYDELMRRVPDHPMLSGDDEVSHPSDRWNLAFLERFLRPGCTYLEVGAGDCKFAATIAQRVKKAYAVEVCEQLTHHVARRPNFEVVISDGTSIPVPDASVDVAFSNQLMEHLHPDDAQDQLRNIYRSLAPGGRYVCVTPNRAYGPVDISQYFDEVATGFHLKEYSIAEISQLFRSAGFSRLTFYVGARQLYIPAPKAPLVALESLLGALPYQVRKAIADTKGARALLGMRVVAHKAE
jgi:SAM-dependent methyltransferase